MAATLPTFAEIAAQRIADAGPRDKTINIKVAINTARMMVEADRDFHFAMLAALEQIIQYADKSTDPGIVSVARAALAKSTQGQQP